MNALDLFGLHDKVAVVTGGGGVLGGALAMGFASAGARVAVADLNYQHAVTRVRAIEEAGGTARAYAMDIRDAVTIEVCRDAIYSDFGGVDILVNCVGGNMKSATTSPDLSFFDLPREAIDSVMDINLTGGTIVPSQIFCSRMKDNPEGGSVINISSMNAFRPLTRIPGYSAAKAAVSNFTQWLAVHLAQEYCPKLRVNAIAPGFFITEQNRFLLTDAATGALTARGDAIIGHTPMGRFGQPDDLVGVAVWLASDAARFVTGVIVPVDGGFSAYAGV